MSNATAVEQIEQGESQRTNHGATLTRSDEPRLSQSDRRVLLISSLTLFLRRARHGFAVTEADLLRLASYGDPADPPAIASAANGVAA
jgi:hypothetical protein